MGKYQWLDVDMQHLLVQTSHVVGYLSVVCPQCHDYINYFQWWIKNRRMYTLLLPRWKWLVKHNIDMTYDLWHFKDIQGLFDYRMKLQAGKKPGQVKAHKILLLNWKHCSTVCMILVHTVLCIYMYVHLCGKNLSQCKHCMPTSCMCLCNKANIYYNQSPKQ